VLRLYSWKSAKWVATIEVLAKDKAGCTRDPWKEERYGW
jgi:DMSO/TMAO reductase YedYZ molybdopterin-dependent catalytic subunit